MIHSILDGLAWYDFYYCLFRKTNNSNNIYFQTSVFVNVTVYIAIKGELIVIKTVFTDLYNSSLLSVVVEVSILPSLSPPC
jgi:hypothetical protein